MVLSEEELQEARRLHNPVVDQLIRFYEALSGDPVTRFKTGLSLAMDLIAKDLFMLGGNQYKQVNELEMSILNRRDDVFERVLRLQKEKDAFIGTAKETGKSKPEPESEGEEASEKRNVF